jgi:hypothetical protein
LKLTIKNGVREVKNGYVGVSGPVVFLMDTDTERPQIVCAYHMIPGETVRRVAEGEWVVEF